MVSGAPALTRNSAAICDLAAPWLVLLARTAAILRRQRVAREEDLDVRAQSTTTGSGDRASARRRRPGRRCGRAASATGTRRAGGTGRSARGRRARSGASPGRAASGRACGPRWPGRGRGARPARAASSPTARRRAQRPAAAALARARADVDRDADERLQREDDAVAHGDAHDVGGVRAAVGEDRQVGARRPARARRRPAAPPSSARPMSSEPSDPRGEHGQRAGRPTSRTARGSSAAGVNAGRRGLPGPAPGSIHGANRTPRARPLVVAFVQRAPMALKVRLCAAGPIADFLLHSSLHSGRTEQ